MPNIKEIRDKIHSVSGTQKMTKTMQLVSSSKLTKAQHQLSETRKYSNHVVQIFNKSIADTDLTLLQPYINSNNAKKRLLIIMSTDKGLCGSFNSNIIKQTENYLRANNDLSSETLDILIIGKKVLNHFKKQNYHLITTYQSISTKLQLKDVREATNWIINAFLAKQYSCVELIYNIYETTAMQAIQIERFLPFDDLLKHTSQKTCDHTPYIYEPFQKELIEKIIPLRLNTQLYKALLESNTAEHSARMAAMSKASENANSILKTLRVTYNKTRQASITNEILEIAAVAEVLRNTR
jgi:F-type H+-transporting ATPase subunit gamma